MVDLFTRSTLNPILRPGREWWKVYNPAAILADDETVHLFPRVVKREEDWHSRIAHATSTDGEHFEWGAEITLAREGVHERRGLEDARVSRIDNTYHMAFAAYDGASVALHTAVATDLNGPWQRNGPALPDFDFFASGGRMVRWEEGRPVEKLTSKRGNRWSKSGAFFPARFGDEYRILFGEFNIWLASSRDGAVFVADNEPLIESRKGTAYFDNTFVEMGPPPIPTDKGWLVLYHGIDEAFRYQLGFVLLDREDPRRILYRCEEPIFGPREPYELGENLIDVLPGGISALAKMDDGALKSFYKKARDENVLPQVVFCPGAVLKDDMLWLYYGAGDTSVCTASAPLQDILDLIP